MHPSHGAITLSRNTILEAIPRILSFFECHIQQDFGVAPLARASQDSDSFHRRSPISLTIAIGRITGMPRMRGEIEGLLTCSVSKSRVAIRKR